MNLKNGLSLPRLLLLLATVAPLTHAFVVPLSDSGKPYRWILPNPGNGVHTNIFNPQTKAIRFFLASDAYSTTNTVAELNAIRAAFAQWQSVPGTYVKFEDGGLVPRGEINTIDNTNVVFWLKNSTFNGVQDMSGVLGLTYTSYDADGQIYEADVVFNGHDFTWFTDYFNSNQSNPAFFVEATALHEIGHFLGLDHSPFGAATMFTRGARGLIPEIGLSSDDYAWVQWAYATPAFAPTYGALSGKVRMNGSGIFGPIVTAENETTGNVVSGTVTRTDGSYFLPALPPGNYVVRASPLDPRTDEWLVAGIDISLFTPPDYDTVVTSFLPTANFHQTITANHTNTLDLTVTSGVPPLHVVGIQPASASVKPYFFINSPATLVQGQQGAYVGVYSPTFDPTCTLSIPGDGLEVGQTIYTSTPFVGSNRKLLSVQVNVATNATPGLRTFVIRRGTDVYYVNGFLDLASSDPDYNFDGLSDAYQRKYFPIFTSPSAAPTADPDGDGQTNAQEFLAGTDPTSKLSLLKIESARQTSSGTTVTWQSDVNKHYQILARDNITGSSWKTNALVIGTGSLTSYLDAPATNQMRFYRVQAIP